MSASTDRTWLEHYPEWTDPHLDYGDTTLNDVYDRTIADHPDRTALRFFGRGWTYAELDERVRRAAAGLRALGVRRGDHVALVMPNCPQHVIAYWAILRLGAIVIEHNPLYTAHELRHPFNDHGARVAICWDKTVPVLEELRRDIVSPKDVAVDDIAVIMYTSGTTGTPKGAQLTHRGLVANILMGKAWVPGLGDEKETVLGVLPLFHAYGLTIVNNLAMLIGAELVLVPAAEMDLIMKVMKTNRPTWVPGVPTLYEKIIDAAEEKNVDITGVKFSFCGASTLPVSIVEKWERLTGGRLVEGYGLTETSPIIVGNPMDGNRRPGYVGIPFPDTDIAVVDPDDPTRHVPDGTEGEVIVRGPQVFAGYLNHPEETEKSFTDGPDGADGGRWYRTGDVGVLEEDGFLRLVARIKEVIITGGFNVYPAEVEEVLLEHPDIVDATVVGLPKSDGSELVVAAVALGDYANLDIGAYRAHARANLTGYKVPRAFFHLDEMPRDQMGKVRRRDVRDVLLAQLEESGVSVDSLATRRH